MKLIYKVVLSIEKAPYIFDERSMTSLIRQGRSVRGECTAAKEQVRLSKESHFNNRRRSVWRIVRKIVIPCSLY